MKKLFGLALIGLMAGTAGAAIVSKDSTFVTVSSSSSRMPVDSSGPIYIMGTKTVTTTTSILKNCSKYNDSNLFFGGDRCSSGWTGNGAETTNVEEEWSTTVPKSATIYGDSVSSVEGGDVTGQRYKKDLTANIDITVDTVKFNRKFKVSTGSNIIASTVVFPFSFSLKCVSGASFYNVTNIEKHDGLWEAVAYTTSGDISADRPYFIVATSETISFKSGSGCSYTINTKNAIVPKKFNADYLNKGDNDNYVQGSWTFDGTYSYKKWNDSELGSIYGFAAKSKDGVAAGQFVKAKSGASIPPMRAYLKYAPPVAAAKAAAGVIASIEEEQLPEVITVKFLDGDGETESIAQLNTRTGEIVADKDAWFDLKGRKLNKKPTVKGTYYNNGQKVIIK